MNIERRIQIESLIDRAKILVANDIACVENTRGLEIVHMKLEEALFWLSKYK